LQNPAQIQEVLKEAEHFLTSKKSIGFELITLLIDNGLLQEQQIHAVIKNDLKCSSSDIYYRSSEKKDTAAIEGLWKLLIEKHWETIVADSECYSVLQECAQKYESIKKLVDDSGHTLP
jgi:hypothetical protein